MVKRVWELSESNESVLMRTIKLETKEGLAQAHNTIIRTIPTVVCLSEGEEIKRFVGTPRQGELEDFVTQYLDEEVNS